MYPLLAEDPNRIGVYALVGRLDPAPGHTVYLGHLLDDETVRVIRLLPPRPDADAQAREQITTTLNAAKRASGAHTARLLEVGWFDDSPYVVREHVEGPTLRQAVAEHGPLAGDALERFAVGTLTALTALHLAGLAHGALTPDTVILGPDGPRVFDIGLVPATGGWEPDYLAPERPREDPLALNGAPADMFAWAATVVHAATGRPPFGGRPEQGPADLSGLPTELRPVLASCLSGRYEERPDARNAMLRLLGEREAADAAASPAGTAPDPVPFPGVVGTVSGAEADTAASTGPDTISDTGARAASGSEARNGTDVTGILHGEDVPADEATPGAAAPGRPATSATSVWGAPQLPQGASPVPGVPAQAPPPAAEKGPRSGNFSMALAVCVGAIVLLSGLGLWAAGRYTALNDLEQASSNGAVPEVALGLADSSQQEPQGADPGQAPGDDPVGKVTVPWGTTPDPEAAEVGPLQLPSDAPTPPVPTIGSYTGPPVAVPSGALTAAPTAPAVPTVPATAPATPTAEASSTAPVQTTPTPVPSLTVEPEAAPTVTPTPVPSPTPTPGQSDPPATPAPSTTPTPAPVPPTPTPSTGQVTPTPVPTLSPTAPPAAPPTARPTNARPSQPVPPTAKPTAKPSQPAAPTFKPTAKPTASPSQPARPTVRPTTRPTVRPTVAPTVAPTVRPTFSTTAKPSWTPPVQRTNPHTPEQVCGAGYTVQRSAPFNGGTAYVLFNAATGNGCAVTIKSANVGTASPVWATLDVQGAQSRTDRRSHEYYAGPVVLPAKGKCVRFNGGVPSGSAGLDWGCR
ncbi:hypothetical protein GCM10017559_28350 [Streptosporangium longisporum]|uniref:Protein kinase domain-containing protein n=1 Tax=Streptosporangium longisporum TaxID=46187 RepID=A0ABP6KGH5_9ACTN